MRQDEIEAAATGAPKGAARAPASAGAVALSPDDLIACPACDLLHRLATPAPGGRARCRRCGAALLTDRAAALDTALACAVAILILIAATLYFPFLTLEAAGVERRVSLLDAVLAFAAGWLAPLVIAMAAFVVAAPAARAALLIYVLGPLRLDRPPLPGARAAYALANDIRPWSMAEIFLLGVAVALVKVAGLASVSLGPAFFACAVGVALIVVEDAAVCRWSIWRMLEGAR